MKTATARISHEEFTRRLGAWNTRITDALAQVKTLPTLAGKVAARREIKRMEAERHRFILAYFELVER